jgi:mono/diheme cytochrome c family protein
MRQFALALTGLSFLSIATLSALDATQVETGKQLFSTKQCTKCHQIEGRGNKANKLDGVASKVSADDMKKWLTSPKEMEAKLDHKPKITMSSKKAPLSASEVDALVAYLQTLK